MFNNKYVKIKRQSYDIGIFGKKGCGKTILLSFIGFLKKKQGFIVFSNYPLKYNHIIINDLKDFNKIYEYDKNVQKVFLGDDFEKWFHSRLSKSKLNVEINDILLDWGKMNCSLIYTAKRSMAIDIGLRDSTCEFWFPELKPIINNNILYDYLNFLKIIITRYDENLESLPQITIKGLQYLSQLYDTQQIVNPITF